MAEEEKQEQEDQPEVEEAAAEAPAEEETPAEEPPAEEAQAEEEAPAEEAPAEEAPAEEAPAEEAPAEPAAEDEEAPLGPKALRKAERSRFVGEPGPQRSPDERAAERAERRRSRGAARRRYRASRRAKRGEPRPGTSPAERRPGPRKFRQGTVVSNKGEKTITVRIEVARRHPVYEKVVRRTATLHAHDEGNEANEGDIVRVVESRPVSRTKRWRLVEVLERAR